MSEDEALFSAVERRDARGCYWDRDDADDARDTGPQDGMGERGHDAFAIVGFKLQDGSRRMLEKTASNGRPREQREFGERGPVLPRRLLWVLRTNVG